MNNPQKPVAPKMIPWKQWLMISLLIWPLSMIVPALLSLVWPLPNAGLMQIIWKGINAFLIVGTLVFLLLPRLVPILSPWLFTRNCTKNSGE